MPASIVKSNPSNNCRASQQTELEENNLQIDEGGTKPSEHGVSAFRISTVEDQLLTFSLND